VQRVRCQAAMSGSAVHSTYEITHCNMPNQAFRVCSGGRRTCRQMKQKDGGPQQCRAAKNRTQPLQGAHCRHAVGAHLLRQEPAFGSMTSRVSQGMRSQSTTGPQRKACAAATILCLQAIDTSRLPAQDASQLPRPPGCGRSSDPGSSRARPAASAGLHKRQHSRVYMRDFSTTRQYACCLRRVPWLQCQLPAERPMGWTASMDNARNCAAGFVQVRCNAHLA
jgi:hypothetical protein